MATASGDVNAARRAVSISGAAFFHDVWTEQIYPAIHKEYDALRVMPASRMTAKHEKEHKDKKDKRGKPEHKEHKEHRDDADIIHDRLVAVLEEVRVKTERRHVYCNNSWTHPSANTVLHASSTYEKISNLALDMFCDTSKVASAEASLTAASAKGDETESPSQPRANLLHAMARHDGRPWKIPTAVERGYEIPICITDTAVVPELGNFKRLGMDCIVNAAWLAFYWATIEEDTDAVSALKNLILDWPMDFVLITGDTPDEVTENMFKWSVNLSAKVERLRDFVGLEANNMMRIVSAAADIMKSKYVNANKKANVELDHN